MLVVEGWKVLAMLQHQRALHVVLLRVDAIIIMVLLLVIIVILHLVVAVRVVMLLSLTVGGPSRVARLLTGARIVLVHVHLLLNVDIVL